ncbi:MAG: hypothetical protein ACREA3_06495 [Nitrosotalea sp.]
MKALASDKSKPIGVLLGVLAIIVVATIAPHAFAITYTDANNPHGPMAMVGWAAAMSVAGVMSGVGIFTAIRRSKLH